MKETVDFQKLIEEAKNGNNAAFEELYNLTIKTAYRTATLLLNNADDVEDVLQNSYIKVHGRLNELNKPESFESWVKTIVENESKNYIKKEKRISAPLIFFKNKAEDYSEEWKKPVPQEYMEKEELRNSVSKIIDGLSPEVRACIVLFHFEDKSLDEIAQTLDIPLGTVKSRLHNGRKQIEKEFNKLRKKDPSLYGIAAIPAVMAVLAYKSANLTVPVALGESVLAGATASGAAAGLTGTVAGGSAVAAAATTGGTVATSAAATAATSVAVKVTAVAVAGSLAVGGSVAIKEYVETKKENTVTTQISSVFVPEETCTIAEILPETQPYSEVTSITLTSLSQTKAELTVTATTQPPKTTKKPVTTRTTATVATTVKPTTAVQTTARPVTTAVPTTVPPTTNPEAVYSLSGGVIQQYTGNDSSVSIPSKVGSETVTAIGAGAFASNPNIKSVAIPSTVTQIGQEAFADCTRLSSVSLPSSLETIGIGAFYGCTALSSVSVPGGTKTIADEAFAECSSLRSIAIPSSVTSIADDAFYGCDSLTIKCSEGSAAHEFALANGFDFTLS